MRQKKVEGLDAYICYNTFILKGFYNTANDESLYNGISVLIVLTIDSVLWINNKQIAYYRKYQKNIQDL